MQHKSYQLGDWYSCRAKYFVHLWDKLKWNEIMKWNEMKWNEMKWNEMKWNEMKWLQGWVQKIFWTLPPDFG